MAKFFSSFCVILAVFLVSNLPFFLAVEAKNGAHLSLSLDLIHRDSQISPFHDPLSSHSDRQKEAFRRSETRVHHFASTGLLPGGGEYLMKISYGAPPIETAAIIDTGSDHSWIQCLPCKNCYQEKSPPFDPKGSSTFEFIPCEAGDCQDVPRSFCDQSSNICQYVVSYGDGSYTRGDLATETVSLSGPDDRHVSSPRFVFGCGHENLGTFPSMVSGVIGFGFRKPSLVSQMYSSIQGRFSYCLVPLGSSVPGKLVLGPNDDVFSGDGRVVATPLSLQIYYTLILEGISVEDETLKYAKNSSTSVSPNNIVIDSGTTVTYLPPGLYDDLELAVRKKIKSDETVPDPQETFSLCYSSLESAEIPKVTMHLKGADLVLSPINTFVRTSESAICLAFVPADGDVFLLGNVQQVNFWVGYDLETKAVSFKPADCTEA